MPHFAGWNIGSMLMTLLAFLLRDWSNLQLVFAVISLLLASYYFLVSKRKGTFKAILRVTILYSYAFRHG